MQIHSEYQKKQFEEIYMLFDKMNKEKEIKISLNDVIITWLTEGYAEEFRRNYLKNHSIITS